MGNWKNQDVDGHGCDVFQPERPSQYGYTIIYLHDIGLQGLTGRESFENAFEEHGLRVIVPHTSRSWWSNKICVEFDHNRTAESYLLKSLVPWLAAHWEAIPPKIALLGIGMGGQGGLRFSFKYPDIFPIVAAITPAIDHQCCWSDEESFLAQMYSNEEAIRQDTATLHIHPLYWPRNIWFCSHPTWIESAQRLNMKLSALGIPHQANLEAKGQQTSGGYEEQMADSAVRFIVERLELERRRIQ
jgi:pimeloyl-ACP methyl ester carboxylesterase